MTDTYEAALEIRDAIDRQGDELREVVRDGLRALVAVQFAQLRTMHERQTARDEIADFMGWR